MAQIHATPSGKASGGSTDSINFSYDCVCSDLLIPEYQQMIVYDLLIIMEGAELKVDGTLVLTV